MFSRNDYSTSRGSYRRPSRRDDRDSEFEDAAAEQRGILNDYNPHNARPRDHHHHHDHHDHHSHGHAGASAHRRASTRYISQHSGDDDVPEWGDYEPRGSRRRDRSAEPRISPLFEDMSEDGYPQPSSRNRWDYSRSNTVPLGQSSGTSAPPIQPSASANPVGGPAAPVVNKEKAREDAPVVIVSTSAPPPAVLLAAAPTVTQPPATSLPAAPPAATVTPAPVAQPTTQAQIVLVAQPAPAPAQPAAPTAQAVALTTQAAAPTTQAAAPTTQAAAPTTLAAVAPTQTVAPTAQATAVATQAPAPAAPAAAPATTTAPVGTAQTARATVNGPGVSRSGWERFQTDPRLRAALDRQLSQRYGRYPGNAPGYGYYPHGPHHHYDPHHRHYDPYQQGRHHHYDPYSGQFDRSTHHPHEYVEDPMAVRQAPHQYGPHLYPFGRPLFANPPELPSLLDRASAPYPVIPVPPAEYLRDLGERPASTVQPRPAPQATPFEIGTKLLQEKKTLEFLEALKTQELEPQYSDDIFRKLSDVIQVRFGEREDDKIVNRVHVVPRGHFALGTVVADHPRLDVDLILPSDFMLRRWIISPTDAKRRPTTAAEALGLDPVSIARSEVDADKLDWVLDAVWEQLDGVADGFIFPGGVNEAKKYLGEMWCTRYKEKTGNRLRLITSPDSNPIRINLFIKVSVNLNGQEMIVGADQSSAKSAKKYQMIKVLRNPGVALGETPLSPIDRSAILTLNWWQRSLKASAKGGEFKIRSNHFLLALAALHALPSTNALHVPRAESTPLPFSIVRVMDVMLKISKYLECAYNPPPTMLAARDADGSPVAGRSDQSPGPAMQYVFPLSACTTMDALYTQAVSTREDFESSKGVNALTALRTDLVKYIDSLSKAGLKPETYTREP